MSKKSIRFTEEMEKYIHEEIPGKSFSQKIKYLTEKGMEKQYQEQKIKKQI